MTKNDIRRIYTEKVAELLAKGYILHPETMSGSQGEMAHIDLTNGFEILRVLIETSLSFDGYGDILTIRVGRCMDEIRGSWHTIWRHSPKSSWQRSATTSTPHRKRACGWPRFVSADTTGASTTATRERSSVTLTNWLPSAGCAASPA